MDIDQRWLTEIGIDAQTGIGYTGSEEKFVSALQRYCKNYEKNSTKVDEYFAAKDLENFMITVHALKSNSKMIGAGPLSLEFEKLENASREGDTATVVSVTPPAMAAYKELVEKLSPVMSMGDVKPADEISAEEAKKTAEALFAALDDFDDDLSKSLAKKLSGYPFRLTQADRLKEAIALIDDFMYDEAAAIVKEIYPTIE
jgi:HPt (histidine-containing phosphotransfer) domain-containing protein